MQVLGIRFPKECARKGCWYLFIWEAGGAIRNAPMPNPYRYNAPNARLTGSIAWQNKCHLRSTAAACNIDSSNTSIGNSVGTSHLSIARVYTLRNKYHSFLNVAEFQRFVLRWWASGELQLYVEFEPRPANSLCDNEGNLAYPRTRVENPPGIDLDVSRCFFLH